MNWQSIFINQQRHVLRSGWRVSIFIVALLVGITLLEFVTVWILTGGEMEQARLALATPGGRLLHYTARIVAVLIASLICLRAFDHLPLRSLGYDLHAGWWRDYLIGAGVAAAMITVVVGIGWGTGTLSLNWSGSSARDLLSGLVMSFVFFHIAAAFEELSLRGYPLQTLMRDLRPAWAILITSTLFGLLHAGNPNVSALGLLNTILAGVWLAVAYFKTRSLWLCTSLHWSWNWTMNAVYGLNVSGLDGLVKGSLMDGVETGPDWLTGGSYGPEGGFLTTAVILTATLLLWRARQLKPAQRMLKILQPDSA